MIQRQLKLRLTLKQEAMLEGWLWNLTGVYNWAVRKIEQDAAGGVYYTAIGFQNLLAAHGERMGIPSHTLQGTLSVAYESWKRRFKKLGGKPKMKGLRNRMNSIPFPDPLRTPKKNRIAVPGLRSVKFHEQELPEGKIKCGRIVKRASGWYLCLFIDAEPNSIERKAGGVVGIDPGFKHLVTLSNGKKIEHPRELELSARRLAQAQRGGNKVLASRINERIANQRKDRNHKVSRQLVAENTVIVFSKDNHRAISKRFGKSVASSSHGQLRRMLECKSRAGGTQYIEVNPANSTKTCSACWCLSGPTGWKGLSVRQWTCAECGASHDRDVNAAINTLIAGAGSVLECSENYARNYSKPKLLKEKSCI
jgi:putative transposase